MAIPVIAFFNNKGGVGKTSLAYHLSWMLAESGHVVLAADLDPQANLSAAFLDSDRLETIWKPPHPLTIYGAVRPLETGAGDMSEPHVEPILDDLGLLVGDMALSGFEDDLAEVWPKCLDRDQRAFRITSAFWRVLQRAGEIAHAEVILMDLGPNLGAINRAAMVASDHVVIPLAPDLFSLQGLRNLGPALNTWRADWKQRTEKAPALDFSLPEGNMHPLGYVVLQHAVRRDRAVRAYQRWLDRIPEVYHQSVLQSHAYASDQSQPDAECFAMLKHYRSLIPLAQDARKPIFKLQPADGALGGHLNAVRSAYQDFKSLALAILHKAGLPATRPN